MMGKREEAARAILAKVPEGYGMREDEALEYVDAVLACIREPDEKMLNGARDWSVAKHGRGVGNDDATQCLQAMIDAVK